MKIKLISALTVTMLLLSISVNAQQPKNITAIKFDPLGAFYSAIPLTIERTFGELHYSALIGGSLIHSRSGSGDNTYNNDGFSITPAFRYYFSNDHEALSRTYAGTWVSYEEHSNTTLDRLGIAITGKAFGRGAGIIFGNQWFFRNGFVVDFFIGPGYMKYEASENYDLNVSKGGFLTSFTGPKNTGTKINLGISLGLSF